MSQHPSLRVDSVGVKHRNVINRAERIKRMMTENRWDEGRSVYNLPKLKSQKVKVKKAKAAKEGDEKAAPGAAPAAATAKKAEPAKKTDAGKK